MINGAKIARIIETTKFLQINSLEYNKRTVPLLYTSFFVLTRQRFGGFLRFVAKWRECRM